MAYQQDHPIFDDIDHGNLEEVQRRVRADAAVLEERHKELWYAGMTPLAWAIDRRKLAIALWLIEHRGQHDVDSTDCLARTALHRACENSPLSVVQALVGAGANPAALDCSGETPLFYASSYNNHTVAFLLQQPAVKASIDTIDTGYHSSTALSLASRCGHLSTVQLLHDAGADPTIPAGQHSPLNQAISEGHHNVAALLRTAIAEPRRPRSLLKARALLDATLAVPEARHDSADEGEPQATQQQEEAIAAAPAYLKGRVAEGRALPAAVVVADDSNEEEEKEELVACVKYALGLEGGTDFGKQGGGDATAPQGMVHDVFIELCEMLVPVWDRDNV